MILVHKMQVDLNCLTKDCAYKIFPGFIIQDRQNVKMLREYNNEIEKQIARQIEQLKKSGDMEKLLHGSWSHMDAFDEDEWLEHLEEHLKEIVNISGKDERTLAARL